MTVKMFMIPAWVGVSRTFGRCNSLFSVEKEEEINNNDDITEGYGHCVHVESSTQ